MQLEGAGAEARAGYALARERVRKASGMRVLLALLHARSSMTAQASHTLRTLAVKCLVGLAHDSALRHILSKLQVWSTVSRLMDCQVPGSLRLCAAMLCCGVASAVSRLRLSCQGVCRSPMSADRSTGHLAVRSTACEDRQSGTLGDIAH